MEEKSIYSRISDIFNLFSDLIVMQIQSLYDDYEEFDLDEIERNYKLNFKNLIDKSSDGLDICLMIKEFIFMEEDPYGLDIKESNIKSDIENIFYDFSRNLSVESMLLRDKWKKEQLGELEENIFYLKDTVNKLNKTKNILEEDLKNTKKKNDDLIKKSKLATDQLQYAKQNLKKEEEKNLVLSKNNTNLSVEIEALKSQNDSLTFEKQSLKEENSNLNIKIKESKQRVLVLEDKINSMEIQLREKSKEIMDKKDSDNNKEIKRIKDECEHLTKGIHLLKHQVQEKDKYIDKALKEKDEINKKYNEILIENDEFKKKYDKLKHILESKDKEIEQLAKEIKKSNMPISNPKIDISDIHNEFNDIYTNVFEQLKKIAMLTKIVEGKNIMMIASKINKIAINIKSSESMSDMKDKLDIFILELGSLNRLLENNAKESGLNKYIDRLEQLQNKL